MVGFGPEDDHFVAELTYNYGIGHYKLGNDFMVNVILFEQILAVPLIEVPDKTSGVMTAQVTVFECRVVISFLFSVKTKNCLCTSLRAGFGMKCVPVFQSQTQDLKTALTETTLLLGND